MESLNGWGRLAGQVGFPIVVAIYLLVKTVIGGAEHADMTKILRLICVSTAQSDAVRVECQR